MDPTRFDDLTRRLGQPHSRRRILAGLCPSGSSLLGDACCPDANVCGQRCLPAPCDADACQACDQSSETCVGICTSGSTCRNGQCCTPDCAGKCGGADDGCGGTCTGGCDAGQACYNGACFSSCLRDPSLCGRTGCPNCACVNIPGVDALCVDSGTGIGTCASGADCPPGTICSGYGSGDPNRPRLCVQACCA